MTLGIIAWLPANPCHSSMASHSRLNVAFSVPFGSTPLSHGQSQRHDALIVLGKAAPGRPIAVPNPAPYNDRGRDSQRPDETAIRRKSQSARREEAA